MPLLRRHCGCVWWLVVVLVNVTLWLGRPVIVCSAAYETADPSNAIDVATSKREIITTAACASVGQASDYPARLDLTYMYSVEFYSDNNENASIDLNGMERAIATSVASTLSACSTDNQPQYAVELSSYSAHRFIDAGLEESTFCSNRINAASNTQCSLVRGITSILLELGSSIAGMDKQIFTLIDATLQDVTFLRQFLSTNLTRVKFDRSIGGNLVVEIPIESSKSKEGQGDSAGGSSRYDVRTTVIVSLISSFLAAMFMYAVYFHRKTDSTDASKSIQERAARVQSKRRQYFQNLDDDPSLSSGWMVTDTMPDAPTNQQTTAWSDLTSDSESIISVLPMDRIDEEGTNEDSENDGEEIEVCLNENESSMVGVGSLSSAGLVSPIHIDHLSFIAHWNIHSEESEEKSLPEEAQTNKGGPKIESIEIEVDSDPFCFEEGDTPVRKNRLSSIEDAATGTATTATYTQESASTAGLRGCEFIFDHNNHASLFHPTGTGTHSLDSSLLDFSSDDDNHEYGGYHSNTDEETENRRQVFVPKAILLRDEAAVGQLRTDALFSEASDTTLVRSSGHNVLPPDTKLADWARLAIGKLTTGGVGLITCTNAHPQMPTNNL